MPLPPDYAHLIEAMPDGVVVTDGQGRVIFVNGLFEKLSGYSSGDLVGRPVETVVPEALRTGHVGHRHDYYQHGMASRPMGAGLEITLQRADGAEVPVDVALSTLQTDGEVFVLASVRDIAERKLAEATIRENERRWSDLLERVQLVVVGLDVRGRVTYANPYLLRLAGYDADQVIGVDWFDVFIPDHIRDELRTAFREVIEEDAHGQLENEIVTRHGTRRMISWFNTRLKDLEGKPSGSISIGEDVTARRRTDARVRALNEVAQAILTGGSAESLLHQVARSAARLLGADVGALLVPLTGRDYEVRAVSGDVVEGSRSTVFPAEGLLVDEVMTTGRTLALTDVQAEPGAVHIARMGEIGPAMLVALWVRGDPFGVLMLANREGGRIFDLDDATEAEAFAAQAAVALAYGQVQQELQSLGVLAERERIARELHDTVIQRLFATGMTLQAAQGGDPTKLADKVNKVVDDLDSVIRDIRGTIFALESARRTAGLRAELLSVARAATVTLGFEPQIRFEGAVDAAVPEHVREPAAATMREALDNVARHAGAHRVEVNVVAGDELVLRVVDDGGGIDPGTGGTGGTGLRAMRERAERLGGRLDVARGAERGTVVEWRVPLPGRRVSG